MGIRANILIDYQVPDFRDREGVLARLAPTVPATADVQRYWNSTQPESPDNHDVEWTASPPKDRPWPYDYLAYENSAGFYLRFGPSVARIRASARWRGFLGIAPLRRVHVCAFRCVAHALGAGRIVYTSDNDPVTDLAQEGATLDQCIAEIERMWGPPQPSINEIAPEVVRQSEFVVPSAWYLERLTAPPKMTEAWWG